MGKFATFLIGGIVGAAAGLLLSPRTGAENRAKVSEAINEKVNLEVPAGVQETAASTSQKVINTVVDNGSDAYKNVVSRVNQNPTVQAFNDNGDELRQKIDAARERIATQVAKNAEAARDAAVDKIPVAIDAAQGAAQNAKVAAQNASQVVSGAAQTAGAAVAGAAQNAGQVVAGAANTAKDAVAGAASSVTAKINPSGEKKDAE